MSKYVGSKLAPFLGEIITTLQGTMKKLEAEQSVDVDNELSEACLTTLQNIIKRCPREVSQHVQALFQEAMTLVIYDPNYIYDEDGDEEMQEEDDGDWGSDFDEGE